LSWWFEAQTVSQDCGLFFNGVFVDARKSVLRHGAHARKDVPVISERIEITPYRFYHRAHESFSAFECEYSLVGCMPP